MIGRQPPYSSTSSSSAAPKSSISGNIAEMDVEDIKDCSISTVIHLLKSSFRADVFRKAEDMLMLRECRLAKERELVEGSLKRLQVESQARCGSLEAELDSFRRRCVELEQRNREAEADFERRMNEAESRWSLLERKLGEMKLAKRAVEAELEDYKGLCKKLEESITRLKEDFGVMRERERRSEEMIGALENDAQENFTEINKLKAKNRDLERAKWRVASDFEESRKRCRELEERVSLIDVKKSCGKPLKNRKVSWGNVSCSEETGVKGSSRKKGEQNAGHGTMNLEERTFRSVYPIHTSANVVSDSHSPVEGTCTPNARGQNGGQFQKQLSFKEDEMLDSKMMPAVMQDANSKLVDEVVLVIGDDDDEVEVVPMSSIKSATTVSSRCVWGRSSGFTREKTFAKSFNSESNEMRKITGAENDRSYEETFSPSITTDRSLSSKMAASYKEEDIPISQLLSKNLKEASATSIKPLNAPAELEFHIKTALSSSHEIVEESLTPSRMLSVATKAKEAESESTRTSFLVGKEVSPKTGESDFPENEFSQTNVSEHETDGESLTPSRMLSVATKAKEAESESTRTSFLVGKEVSPKTGESDFPENEFSQTNVSEHETDGDRTVSEEETDTDTSLGEFLEQMRRSKQSRKWDYEADMLSSFSKDPLLCMSAVCAIYRQQISNKQSVQQSHSVKNRGFLMFDMLKGSELALYLMDGDCKGPLKKSAEELEKHDPAAVDYCLQLVSGYSKQLFEIYQNQEDLFFP